MPPATPAEEAWRRFVAAAALDFGEADLVALSREQLREEIARCGVEDAVEAARVEVQWQLLQRRPPRRESLAQADLQQHGRPVPRALSPPRSARRSSTPPQPAPTPPGRPSPQRRSASPAGLSSAPGYPLWHPAPFEVPMPAREARLGRRTPLRPGTRSPFGENQPAPASPRGILCMVGGGGGGVPADPNEAGGRQGGSVQGSAQRGLRTSFLLSGGTETHDRPPPRHCRGVRRFADGGAMMGGVVARSPAGSPRLLEGSQPRGACPVSAPRQADPNSLVGMPHSTAPSAVRCRARTPPPVRSGADAQTLLSYSAPPPQAHRAAHRGAVAAHGALSPPWLGGGRPVSAALRSTAAQKSHSGIASLWGGDPPKAAAAAPGRGHPSAKGRARFVAASPQIEPTDGALGRSEPPPGSPDARQGRALRARGAFGAALSSPTHSGQPAARRAGRRSGPAAAPWVGTSLQADLQWRAPAAERSRSTQSGLLRSPPDGAPCSRRSRSGRRVLQGPACTLGPFI